MSDPPPSSAQPTLDPPLFHHPDGARINIFVEAGGILNRPRLIRNLKKHDAVICSDPKNAQVILVDADSWQGREFIREWGKDQNKVVLSYTWVTKCVSVGKPLLAADNWGDCLTRDDGLPILRPVGNGEGGEVATKSPLPTPRETPIETGPASALSKKLKTLDPPAKRLSTDKTLSQIDTTPASPVISPTMPQPQSQSQAQPHSAPIHSPSVTDSMSVFAQQQTMPFTMPNGVMAPYNVGMNMMSFPPQVLAMFAQQQQQAAASSPMSTQSSAIMPQMSENFTTALMDIMYRGMPGGMPMSQWPMMGMMPPQMQQQLAQSNAGSSGSGTAVREGSSAASGSRRDTESPGLSLPVPAPNSPSVLQSSIKRKRKSDALEYDSIDDLPGTEEDDDGEDEPSLAALVKKKKKSEQRQKHKAEKEERKGRRSSLPYTAPARKPYESQSQAPKPSSSTVGLSGKLFVNSGEKPMQFFVQVDLKDRLEVTRAIKKNGGVLTSEIATADYAVLYSRSTTFKELLHNATATRTPAVSFHFVLDAVEHGSVPSNLDDYLFNVKQNLKKKKKVVCNNAADAEAKRLVKNAKQAERAAKETAMKYTYVAISEASEEQPSPASAPPPSTTVKKGTSATPKPVKTSDQGSLKGKEKEKEKERVGVPPHASTPTPTVKKPTPAAFSTTASASTSSAARKARKKQPSYYPKDPSPTPPTHTERISQGFLYTAEEKEWIEKYLFVLFKRDPDMGQTAVSKTLNRKLKHHSVNSISTFLTMNFRPQYEEARKRGGIAHRKEKSWWEEEQQREEKLEQEREQRQEQQKAKEREQEQEKAQENKEDHLMEDVNDVRKDGVMSEEKDGTLPMLSPMEVDEPPKEAEVPPSTTDAVSEKQAEKPLAPLEEEDMQIIVQFFLDGGDTGEEPEEQVWAKLEQNAKCKSAANWDEFYSRHHSEVVARYTTRLEEKEP